MPSIKRIDVPMHVELDKRRYVPFEVTDTCPECGEEVTTSLDEQYLMYPVIGEPYEISLYHEIDDEENYDSHEWQVKVILDFTLKIYDEH